MGDDAMHASAAGDHPQKSSGSVSGASPTPNPRSCVTCRRRKVKCDKKHPCSNCVRAKIECIFPGPGRAPRKSRKPPDGELMERLRRLEGVVQNLNAQVEEHEQEAAQREKQREDSTGGCPVSALERAARRSVAEDNSVEGLETRFGRLVVDQGRSRYINNSFWASLNNEVEDLKSVLIDHSDDEEDQDSPETTYSSQHQGFVFGYSSTNVDMSSLHPLPEKALDFWSVYKENVDPLVKVLHIPTFEPVIVGAITQSEKVTKTLEPLMFAIYYGAVTSVTPKDCVDKWGEERAVLLNKYRFGLEQALARANFLFCDEMIILQAFIIFMVLLRRNDDARKIWTLTGLVVRIAQTLGIHRDGSHFDLSPFEIEMRRRLWWQVCILDARSSEDHGCDPTIIDAQFDTKMPLNINDADIDPSMTEFPVERQGFTDMTFCLIRYEVTNIFRRILYIPPGLEKVSARCSEVFAHLTVPEKEKWISDCHQRLEEKYLSNCDMSIPLCWVTATISRLIMCKMWLVVYHPHQRRDGGASLPQETKNKLFITSLENIEYSVLLETEARTMKWGWLFRTYVQWHAIAFLLSELCIRTKGEAVERAWRALEATAGQWWFPLQDSSPFLKGKVGCLWKPLGKLLAKARAARERELVLERASQALKKGGGIYYSDFPQLMGQLPAEPPPEDQPSPEELDSMLRPTAPKLGDMPVAQPPTWTSSPSLSNTEYSFPPAPGNMPNLGGKSTNDNAATIANTQTNPMDTFNSLSEQGLDYIIRDVMDGMAFDGSSMNNTAPDTTFGKHNNYYNEPNNIANSHDGMIQNSAIPFADVGFKPEPGDSSSGQASESPVLEGGENMDWAVWDDLVKNYGADGGQFAPTANGAGHLGMVHWF